MSSEKFECKVDFNEKIDLELSFNKMRGIPEEVNTQYTLLCRTIHLGSNGYGHTIAFYKHFDDQYYLFNDSSFNKTSLDKIKNKKFNYFFTKKTIND